MSILVIRLFGREVDRVDLNQKSEWRAGRSDQCDIVLQKEAGISREHLLITPTGDQLGIEAISKYGKVLVNGEDTHQAMLSPGDRFSIPPYEFEYEVEESLEHREEASSNLPARRDSNSVTSVTPDNEEDDFLGNDEKTSIVSSAEATPHIKIMDEKGYAQQILRLEGNFWMAGRDPSNAIHITDSRVSRQQFEITKQGESFYIRDLESVNGTLINGNLIPTNEPTPLISGDTISVLENHLVFELRDASFNDKISQLPIAPVYSQYNVMAPQAHSLSEYQAYADFTPPDELELDESPLTKILGQDKKTQIIRGSLIAILVFGAIFAALDSGPKKPKEAPTNIADDPLAGLTPEQKSLVKHTYELARSLLMQGKYELAAAEIAKVHEQVPYYEDSKEIEATTKRAFELKKQKELIERQAREAAEMEAKIQNQVQICRKSLNNNITSEEMITCLAPAMELNPEHADILALQREVEAIIEERRLAAIAAEARQAEVQKGKNLYFRAKRLDDKENWLAAISAYQRYLNSSYPDPNNYKSTARSRISSIRSMIDSKVKKVVEQSDALYKERNLKEAALILDKALEIDPGNDEIKSEQNRIVKELEKEMRILYQESILEESLGKISAARDRWNTIIQKDVPHGEYFKKATIKLKRSGSL